VVIDVTAKVKNHPDYLISVDDIKAFEHRYRPLSSKDIVLFYTGWSRHWKTKKIYLGSDKLGDVTHLHFPEVSEQAARYLLAKNIKALGIDSASMDAGEIKDNPVHQVFLGANKYGLENLTNLEELPAVGAKLIVAPMKIKGGSGAPVRVFALLGH
jgi:kynurenine formamidase